METLTLIPVTSTYHYNGKQLCTYFPTSLLDRIKAFFTGPEDQRILLLGHCDVVNNKAVYADKLPSISSIKLCQDIWNEEDSECKFSGFACALYGPQLQPGLHPYIYDVMRSLSIEDLIVVVVYGDQELAIHHFDDAFVDWFSKKYGR